MKTTLRTFEEEGGGRVVTSDTEDLSSTRRDANRRSQAEKRRDMYRLGRASTVQHNNNNNNSSSHCHLHCDFKADVSRRLFSTCLLRCSPSTKKKIKKYRSSSLKDSDGTRSVLLKTVRDAEMNLPPPFLLLRASQRNIPLSSKFPEARSFLPYREKTAICP